MAFSYPATILLSTSIDGISLVNLGFWQLLLLLFLSPAGVQCPFTGAKTHPIRVDKLAERVRYLLAKETDVPDELGLIFTHFERQFNELLWVGYDEERGISQRPENQERNRCNIHHPDKYLVKLSDGAYVNASHIYFSHNPSRRYIATQGPLPDTMQHLWQMVWEQRCPAIVALGKDVEGGITKFEKYWPFESLQSTSVVTHGDFKIEIISEIPTQLPGISVRKLKLTHTKEPEKEPHEHLHFHNEAWPDADVPESLDDFIAFVRLFRRLLSADNADNNRPILVHCSAGVGRTGTFIVFEHLLDDILPVVDGGIPLSEAEVDVFGCVYEMREKRIGVLLFRQYVFVHLCLLYVVDPEAALALQHTAEQNRVTAGWKKEIDCQ